MLLYYLCITTVVLLICLGSGDIRKAVRLRSREQAQATERMTNADETHDPWYIVIL